MAATICSAFRHRSTRSVLHPPRLHHPRYPQPRFASSTTPSSAGSSAQKKAQDAYAAASKYAGNAFETLKKAAEPVSARVGNTFGSSWSPLMYNLSVTREILKQVYIAERLQPPMSLQTWTSAYTTLAQRASSPNYWREIFNTGEWARVGLYAVEAYTIFKIGEVIGRRSLVGYNIQ